MRWMAFLLMTALPALAQDLAPGQMIAVVSGDWNGDELGDAVALVGAEDLTADLVVYRGTFRGLAEVLRVPAVAQTAQMMGAAPGLEQLPNGSIRLTTEQTGIGRSPWTQGITLAWREGGFVVAGFSYAYYDRIEPGVDGSCDVNLLTGDWTLRRGMGEDQPEQRSAGRIEGRRLPLAQLDGAFFPEVCSALW